MLFVVPYEFLKSVESPDEGLGEGMMQLVIEPECRVRLPQPVHRREA